jgi:predicted permease
VSHGLWQRRFAGRADVLGQSLKLSGLQYTVVGVAPPGFTGRLPGLEAEFWVPVSMVDRLSFSGLQAVADSDPGQTRLTRRGTRWLFVTGRLRDGVSLQTARAQADTLFARLRREYPSTNEKTTASVLPAAAVRYHPMLDGYLRSASALLLGAVGLVLLIACANVANLLLARGAARRRELAVRAAIGASRGRLVAQLLSESLVLALAGGALGLLIAHWAGAALAALPTDALPLRLRFDFGVDRAVFAFATLASLLTTVLFGLMPALRASKPDLVPSLKADATGEGSARRRLTLRDALVVGQLAVSLLLLVAGALLFRGLVAARATDLGYDPAPIASLEFNLQMNGYDLERATALRERALSALRGVPGVLGVASVSRLPLAGDINIETVHVPGQHAPDSDGAPVDAASVGPDYFRVVGVSLVEGRAFTQDECDGERRVAIVNETLARRFWPGRSPLGQPIHLSGLAQPAHEIVGVARDHKVRTVGEDPRPYIHVPMAPSRTVSLAVRTAIPPATALPALRAALLALEPAIVFTEDATAAEVAAHTTAPTRVGATLLGAFGLLALLLAAVGLYGVVAYSVSLRTREVGVRMALGARPADVVGLVLAQGARLAGAGVAIGALLAALVGRVLQSLLYGVSAADPLAHALAAGVLLLVAAAANLIPALGAARIDPIRTLRAD